MSGHPTYQPQSAFMRWMERRLPIAGLVYSSFIVYPTPRNLNYWWTFGAILSFIGLAMVSRYLIRRIEDEPRFSAASTPA